jgi:hypothetical protein
MVSALTQAEYGSYLPCPHESSSGKPKIAIFLGLAEELNRETGGSRDGVSKGKIKISSVLNPSEDAVHLKQC